MQKSQTYNCQEETDLNGYRSHAAVSRQELIRILSIVRVTDMESLGRIFPASGDVLKTVISHLFRERRIVRMEERIALDFASLNSPVDGMDKAFRVFADFYPGAEYYTGEEWPGMFSFFADGCEYEILYAPPGRETFVNRIAKTPEEPPKRLIVIEDAAQTKKLRVPNTAAYCLADADGSVRYLRGE